MYVGLSSSFQCCSIVWGFARLRRNLSIWLPCCCDEELYLLLKSPFLDISNLQSYATWIALESEHGRHYCIYVFPQRQWYQIDDACLRCTLLVIHFLSSSSIDQFRYRRLECRTVNVYSSLIIMICVRVSSTVLSAASSAVSFQMQLAHIESN
jgi:hypothetical protein